MRRYSGRTAGSVELDFNIDTFIQHSKHRVHIVRVVRAIRVVELLAKPRIHRLEVEPRAQTHRAISGVVLRVERNFFTGFTHGLVLTEGFLEALVFRVSDFLSLFQFVLLPLVVVPDFARLFHHGIDLILGYMLGTSPKAQSALNSFLEVIRLTGFFWLRHSLNY